MEKYILKVYDKAIIEMALSVLTSLIIIGLCSCNKKDDSKYLVELDDAISKNDHFVAQKEYLINELKRKYYGTNDEVEAYNIAIDIYQNYQYYSLDSAYIYIYG